MATVVYCDPDVLGRVHKVWARGELGAESPLEFDEDGYALVEDDEAAEAFVRRRTGIEYGPPDYFDDTETDDQDGEPPEQEPDDADADEAAEAGDSETEDAAETCSAVKQDGEVCGRDLPCQYHSEE